MSNVFSANMQISSAVPGSCFANWLQGNPRTTKPRSLYLRYTSSRPAYLGVTGLSECAVVQEETRIEPDSSSPVAPLAAVSCTQTHCGVKLHCDATLTTSVTCPRKVLRRIVSPVGVLACRSCRLFFRTSFRRFGVETSTVSFFFAEPCSPASASGGPSLELSFPILFRERFGCRFHMRRGGGWGFCVR